MFSLQLDCKSKLEYAREIEILLTKALTVASGKVFLVSNVNILPAKSLLPAQSVILLVCLLFVSLNYLRFVYKERVRIW